MGSNVVVFNRSSQILGHKFAAATVKFRKGWSRCSPLWRQKVQFQSIRNTVIPTCRNGTPNFYSFIICLVIFNSNIFSHYNSKDSCLEDKKTNWETVI